MALNFSAFKSVSTKTSSKLNLSSFGVEKVEPRGDDVQIKTIDRPGLGLKAQFLSTPSGKLAKETRGTGSFKTKKGQEIDHSIPVSLGGTSRDSNLQYLKDANIIDKFTQKDPFKRASRQDGKMIIELKAIEDYKKGRIGLNEARQRVLNWNNQPESSIKLFAEAILESKPVKTAISLTSLLNKTQAAKSPLVSTIDSIRGASTKEDLKQSVTGTLDTLRASTQVAATPLAAGFGATPGGATPLEGATESLKLARDMWTSNDVHLGKNVDKAAQMYLENQKIGRYGGNEPSAKDVVVLSALGFANIFGDPAFEVGLGLKGIRALKEFKTFKKTGTVKKTLPEGQAFVKGKEVPREIKISDDLKVKINPKGKTVTIKGYERRFPTQKGLPEGATTKEVTDIVKGIEQATGATVKPSIVGGDLVLKTTQPLAKTAPKVVQPTVKAVDPLIQEAKKYKSADDFVNEQTFYRGEGSSNGKGNYFTRDQEFANEFAGIKPLTETTIPESQIYRPKELGFAGNEKDVTQAISEAKGKGYKAVYLSEGSPFGEPIESVFVFDKSAITPKSQLTDIWNKAQEKPLPKPTPQAPKQTSKPVIEPKEVSVPREQIPAGEGKTKVSKLEARVKNQLDKVSQQEIDDIGLSTFRELNKESNIKAASEFVAKDPDQALRVLKGEVEAPKGVLTNSVFVAMNNLAKGDTGLALKLASVRATRLGQELSILTEIDKGSPVSMLQELYKIREASFEKRTKTKPKTKLTAEQKKIQREIKAVEKSEAQLKSFIDSIIC